MVHPDIWTDEKFLSLPGDESRLLFIGMMNFADDEGIFKHCTITIKCQVRPFSSIKLELIEDYLNTMVELRLLEKGTDIDGSNLLRYRNWHDYQKINHPTISKHIFNLTIDDKKPNSVNTKVGLKDESGKTTSQYSIDKSSIDKNSIDKGSKKNQDFTFERIWDSYPVKKSKIPSFNAFKRIPKRTMEVFTKGLKAHIIYWEKYEVDRQFIPHLSTFINKKRWEDELIPPTSDKPKFKDPLDKQIYERQQNAVKETQRMTAYMDNADKEACDDIPDLNEIRRKSNAQPLSEGVGQFMSGVKLDTSTDGE